MFPLTLLPHPPMDSFSLWILMQMTIFSFLSFFFFFFFFQLCRFMKPVFFFCSRQVRRRWGINNSYIPLCAHARHQSCVFVCAVITPAGPKRLFLFSFFFSPYSNLRLFLKPKTKERSGFNSTKLKYKNKGTHNWNQYMNTFFFSSHIHPVLWSRMTALWKNDNTLCYGKKGELVQAKNALFRQLRSHQGPSMD